MRIVVTGADGFLGWHLRVCAKATTGHVIIPVGRKAADRLPSLVQGADALVHLAGINRGTDEDLSEGNVALARGVAEALDGLVEPLAVVYADSVQSGNGTPYGTGKAGAGRVLEEACERVGGRCASIQLPNLFGEHGRADYNSFVATFVASAARGEAPQQLVDRKLQLMHAQTAAEWLLAAAESPQVVDRPSYSTSVRDVWSILEHQRQVYAGSDIPELPDDLHVDLFNCLRARMFPEAYPLRLMSHADHRGRLIETVRAHGSSGQAFFSVTAPGHVRGEHYHRRKVERFVVLSGRARISLRRLLTQDVVSFDVSGDKPAVIDMPTMWVHNLVNTGDSDVAAMFWADQLFDPSAPDTYPEHVVLEGAGP